MTTTLDLVESIIRQALAEARIDRTLNTINGVVLMNSISQNGPKGRRYSEKSMRDLVGLSEGLPAYANHVADKSKAFMPRDIREMVGRYKGVRYDGIKSRVTADLHLLPEAKWLLSLAEQMGDVIGISPVSRGVVRVDSAGVEIVEEIVAVRSADIVSDPATTKGLFEHRDHQEDTMTTTQKARTTIAAHNLGKKYGSIPAAVSDVFVGLLVEAGESRWPALLDERLALLDGTARPAPPTRVVREAADEPRTDIFGRMRAAIEGRPYIDLATIRPSARELQEAAEREQHIRERDEPVAVPTNAHTTLREALTGETASNVPADAHARMRRAFTGGR